MSRATNRPVFVNRFCTATMASFNGQRYRETGKSFGFANAGLGNEEIYVGTDLRATPRVVRNTKGGAEIVLEIPEIKTFPRLTPETMFEGAQIMICASDGKKGLSGPWCFRKEWEEATRQLEDVLKEIKVAAERLKQQQEEQAAKARQDAERNPKNFDEALANGWKVVQTTSKGRQIIVERTIDGRNVRKHFHVPRAKALQLQLT